MARCVNAGLEVGRPDTALAAAAWLFRDGKDPMPNPQDVLTATLFAQIEKERAALAHKTERLRALRLAKESEERNCAASSGDLRSQRKRRIAAKVVRINVQG